MRFASQGIRAFRTQGYLMTNNHDNDSDQQLVINFADTADLEIATMDIGVTDGVIAFDISGKIENITDSQLDDLTGEDLKPAKLSLTVVEPS